MFHSISRCLGDASTTGTKRKFFSDAPLNQRKILRVGSTIPVLKILAPPRFLAIALSLILCGAFFCGEPIIAANYTYSASTTTTTQWSAGTSWNATPVSASDTTLNFSATQAAGINTVSNNDLGGSFTLNRLNITYVGPATGTAPTLLISGNALAFTSNGATAPTLVFGQTGTIRPSVTISNNIILSSNLTLSNPSASNTAILSGTISGSGGLNKTSGTGGVNITGTNNSFSGAVVISASGSLTAASIGNTGSNSSLGTNSSITLGGGGNAGQLNWTGTSETTDKIFTMGGTTGSATLSASTASQTLTISQNLVISGNGTKTLTLAGSGNIAFNGIIPNGTSPNTSVISLTKSGTGTATLGGANTYTGATTISAGTLQIGSGGTTGALSTSSAITNNANLIFNRSNTITQGTDFSAIAGTGNVTQAGSGTTVLASANTYTGATRITAGTLQIGNGGTTGALSTSSTITNNGTLDFNRSNDVVQGTDFSAAAITGTGNLTQSGTGNLTLNAANTYSGATTINSGTLIASGGSAIADAGTVILANASGALFSITGSETIGSLRGGGISGGNATIAASQTLTVAETGNQTFSGSIQGSGEIAKTGVGTWSLDGTNIYSGATTISAGTLQIGNGGTSGALSTSSAITNNATLSFNRSDTLTQGTDFASVIAGTGALRQSGSGTLVLNGVNTFTGSTTVSAGTLQISNAGALGGTGGGTSVSSCATLAMSGNITVAGESLSLSGSGIGGNGALRSVTGSNTWNTTITLLADSTIGNDQGTLTLVPGTGTITAANFTLTLTGAGNFAIARQIALGTGGLTMNGTGTFTMGTAGSSAYTGNTTINSGTLSLGNSDRINDASLLIVNGGVFGMAARNETVAGVTLAGGTITSTTGTLVSLSDYNFQNGTISAVMNGTVALNKTTAGNVTLSGANIYSGGTTVTQGTLALSGSGSLGMGGITLSGGTINLGGKSITNTLASFSEGSLINGTITNDGATYTVGNGTIGAILAGTNGLASTGTVTLSSANTYSGGTSVTLGQLNLNDAAAIGTGTLTVAGGAFDNTSGAAITLSSNNAQNWNGDFAFQGTNDLNMGTGSVTLSATRSLAVNGGNLTVGGVISGSGFGLSKSGSGALILTGANAYTGTTTITAGTLQIGEGSTTGALSSSSAISNNATLAFNRSNTLTQGTDFNSIISGSGSLIQAGSGSLIITGANTYTGTSTISAGTLQLGNNGATGSLSASGMIDNNGTLVFRRSNAISQGTDFSAAAITGTGMVIHNSASSTTLTNDANSFSGGVWVQNGTLYANNFGNSGSASFLGTNGTIKLGNGTTAGTLRFTNASPVETTDKVIDLAGTTGGASITAGNATITMTGDLAMSGTGNKALSFTSSGNTNTFNLTFNGLLADGNGTLSLGMGGSGNGNFILGNANNSFSGSLILNGNTPSTVITVSIAGIGNAGANSYLGKNGTINLGATTATNALKYTGVGEITDKVINLYGTTGGAAIDQSGASGLLKFTSSLTASGSGAKTLTLQGSTGGTGEFAGIIVDSGGGATSVQKAGTGTWTLSGNNTYTGQSILNSGTTIVSTLGNFGESSNLGQGASGTSIRMGATTTTGTLLYTGSGNTSNRTFQVGNGNGAGGATLTNNGSGALVFTASAFNSADTSSVTGSSNRTLTLRGSNTGNNEIQGSISNSTNGTVSVTKADAGTWKLSGTNTYTGATTISAGTLVLNGTNSGSAITVNSGGTLAGSGTGGATTVNSGGKIAPGNSPGILTVGNLTLNGNATYTWEMADATGIAGTGWDQINATGLLSIGSNATSTFTIAITSSGAPANWNYATTNQTWDILDYGTISGFNASYFTLNSTAFGGDLTPDSSWVLTDTGSTLRLTYTYILNTPTYAGGTGVWSTGFTPAITNSANAIFFGTGGTATNDIASGTLSGIGSLTFDGTNSYTLEANSGSAGYNAATALAIGGTIVNNSSAVQTINLATSFAANQTINANTGGIVIGGDMAVATGATLTVVGSNSTTLSGVVSGLGGLTKNSSSTLNLSGNNTYSGNTTIGQGKVLIGDNNAFGSGKIKLGVSGVNATITLSSTDSTARTISNALDTFAGNSWVTTFGEAIGGTGDLSFTNGTSVSLGSTSRTFHVLNTTSFANSFSTASGSIIKTGAGTLVLTGASTYNAATIINAGTLQLGDGGTTGSLSISSAITNNGTLVFNRSNAMTQGTAFAAVIAGTGNVVQAGTGTLALSGANTYTGTTTVSAGNVTISNASALGGTGSGTTVANGAALQIQGDIAVGAEALNLTGSGFSNAGALRNLSGTNSYAGAITLSGATTIGSDAGTLTLSGGISGTQNLTLGGAGNMTLGGSIATSTGTLTKNGNGTATLGAANTYTGTTTINSGTLVAAASNALGGTSQIVVNGGSLLVTADDAINGKNITINGTATFSGDSASLIFSGNYSGTAGSLTLSDESAIDLGTGSVFLHFTDLIMGLNSTLAIYNWTGTTLWAGGDGNNTDQFYVERALSNNELNRIGFYSDLTNSSFIGTAFQLSGGSFNREIIPVPEPETYAAAVILLLSLGLSALRRSPVEPDCG